jgi:hypothetical protein
MLGALREATRRLWAFGKTGLWQDAQFVLTEAINDYYNDVVAPYEDGAILRNGDLAEFIALIPKSRPQGNEEK